MKLYKLDVEMETKKNALASIQNKIKEISSTIESNPPKNPEELKKLKADFDALYKNMENVTKSLNKFRYEYENEINEKVSKTISERIKFIPDDFKNIDNFLKKLNEKAPKNKQFQRGKWNNKTGQGTLMLGDVEVASIIIIGNHFRFETDRSKQLQELGIHFPEMTSKGAKVYVAGEQIPVMQAKLSGADAQLSSSLEAAQTGYGAGSSEPERKSTAGVTQKLPFSLQPHQSATPFPESSEEQQTKSEPSKPNGKKGRSIS